MLDATECLEGRRLSGADYELKFVGERASSQPVRCWLQKVCKPDPSFAEGVVFTIYYDTPMLECLDEKRNSDYLKTKIRLRWYNVTGTQSDNAFLEVKRRYGARREKIRAPSFALRQELVGAGDR